MRRITVYTDYKSPYAYLAKDLAYELDRDFPVRLEWRPYVLDIPSFLGSARLDAEGQRAGGGPQRTSMASRALQLHGLPSPGAQTRTGDSRTAEDLGFLACRCRHAACAARRRWRCSVATTTACSSASGSASWISRMSRSSPPFWQRPVPMALRSQRTARKVAMRWPRSAARRKRRACSACRAFVVDGELFWGREHLPDIRAMLAA